jgi:ubiquinol-cytochrome c reductase cytochrome c1 subunit
MLRTRIALLAASLLALAAGGQPAAAKTREAEPKPVAFSFDGPLGKYDQAALQRGYKVYAEVCSSCHSMNLVFYRNLCQRGGPFYDSKHPNPIESPYCKAIAADIKVPDIDQDTGDAVTRPATPADHFKAPYPNANAAAAANGGAAPPDLSLIVKAREGGARYVYSLLTGYVNPPAGLTVTPGKYYNPYYPGDLGSFWTGAKDKVPEGGFISMPFQLTPGRVTFDDGAKSTTEQQAHDVVTFLAWASEPLQEEREQTGLAVLAYLVLFAGITFLSYKRIWRNIAH